MVLPNGKEIKQTVLNCTSDKTLHSLDEIKQYLVKKYEISDSERSKISVNNKRNVFDKRVVDALTGMRKAELLENKERGVFKITKNGLNALNKS
jgi:restriction endonuclease Mrr